MSKQRDWLGALVGLAVFLGGIAIIFWAFQQAYSLFGTPPETVLGVKKGETLDLNRAGANGIGLVTRCLLLLVISIIGSVIANRGIKLYSESQRVLGEPAPTPAQEPKKD
ncbi:MAG: hypothetical protein JNJ45_00725 [Chthonomonas sp.]|nr:hypothetical protein [Chthonomonas sp.]